MRLSPLIALATATVLFAGGIAPAEAAEPDLIDVGDQPVQVAFSPDGGRFYVLHYGADTLTAYSTATRQVIFTTPVADEPVDLDVSPDGTRIAVASKSLSGGGVTIVTASTGAATGVGSPYNAVAFSPDGSRLYGVGQGQLIALHPYSGAYLRSIPMYASPAEGLAFDASGNYLYVLMGGWGGLHRMKVANESFDYTHGWGSYGGTPLITPDGTRAVFPTSGSLMVTDLLGSSEPRLISGVDAGSEIVPNPWGSRAYVANGSDISEMDLGAEEIIGTVDIVGPAAGIAMTPDGSELWATLPGLDQIQVIDVPRLELSGDVAVARIAGPNRYETAVAISQEIDGPISTVFIASGEKFPDALGAAPAAIVENAVLLLTPKSMLPASVQQRIQQIGPSRIVFLGSTASIDENVRAAVLAVAPGADLVEISGADRFATSRAIIDEFFPVRDSLFIATGLNFPDALSAGPVAGIAGQGILLVNGGASTIDAPTEQVFWSDPQVSHAVIVGGLPSVSADLRYDIYAKTPAYQDLQRIYGGDRFSTAQNLNGRYFDTANVAYLASGLNFPDALTGAVLAGREAGPLYVVPPNCVPQRVIDDLVRLGVSEVFLLGSEASLGSEVFAMTPCS